MCIIATHHSFHIPLTNFFIIAKTVRRIVLAITLQAVTCLLLSFPK